MIARILTGTCSWTDKSLVDTGRFYPTKVKSAEERLRFYADEFPLVEVVGHQELGLACRPPPR